jgi:hypothetical protein
MVGLRVPFTFRDVACEVVVAVRPNDDPSRYGCDLLDPSLPADAAADFPVCTAEPVLPLRGYRAACGWIQVVRSTDSSGEFEMDPLALFRDVATPFAFFGIAPTLFDAPFRESRYDLVWKARAFLAASQDGVMSKTIRPLAAFEWGFTVAEGAITIDDPTELSVATWNEHRQLFSTTYPGWTFELFPRP